MNIWLGLDKNNLFNLILISCRLFFYGTKNKVFYFYLYVHPEFNCFQCSSGAVCVRVHVCASWLLNMCIKCWSEPCCSCGWGAVMIYDLSSNCRPLTEQWAHYVWMWASLATVQRRCYTELKLQVWRRRPAAGCGVPTSQQLLQIEPVRDVQSSEMPQTEHILWLHTFCLRSGHDVIGNVVC